MWVRRGFELNQIGVIVNVKFSGALAEPNMFVGASWIQDESRIIFYFYTWQKITPDNRLQ